LEKKDLKTSILDLLQVDKCYANDQLCESPHVVPVSVSLESCKSEVCNKYLILFLFFF